jgi:mRNA-degrading endonuclease RelE of RelBE toxin-antitoxin system
LTWRVFVHRDVRRFERRHPNYKGIITRAIEVIAENPYSGERLTGPCQGLWKLRIGDLRVVYRIEARSRTVYILWAGFRGRVYKGRC